MSTDVHNKDIISFKKKITGAIAQARLRFETIFNNNLFFDIMSRSKLSGGFPPLRYLQTLFVYASRENVKIEDYDYDTLYQLIELLAYFVYYCRIIINVEEEAQKFLSGRSSNIHIQVKLALEMFPKNLDTLSSNIRFLLAYVTSLERSATSAPIYKKYSLLFKVEKLIFATEPIVEIKPFEAVYDNK